MLHKKLNVAARGAEVHFELGLVYEQFPEVAEHAPSSAFVEILSACESHVCFAAETDPVGDLVRRYWCFESILFRG